jgi:hypothetical protein
VPIVTLETPLEIARHLRKRIRERSEIPGAAERIYSWIESEPEVPSSDWYKDFGDFYLCGSGLYPKTILSPDMKPYGKEVE